MSFYYISPSFYDSTTGNVTLTLNPVMSVSSSTATEQLRLFYDVTAAPGFVVNGVDGFIGGTNSSLTENACAAGTATAAGTCASGALANFTIASPSGVQATISYPAQQSISTVTNLVTHGPGALTGFNQSFEVVPGVPVVPGAFQVAFASNLNVGESYIDISNDGANGAPLLGPGFGGAVGNICANVYTFSPDEQLIACCSCLVTPNGLINLGVNRDLTSKTLTGVIPTSVVVKMVATLAGVGGSGTSCTNSAASVTTATLAPGFQAWRTTLHNGPPGVAAFGVTETPFTMATLSLPELASIGGRCASILGNGSGFGICKSCQAGALGGSRM